MQYDRNPGTPVLVCTGDSVTEMDAFEDFVRNRVDITHGDSTGLQLKRAEIQKEIATLTADLDAITDRDDPKFAEYIRDRSAHIADLNAVLRVEERRVARPVITARNP